MNYGELKQTVADWLARADLTADLPTCVTFAEARINRELSKVGAGELTSTALATVSGTETVDLPSDFNGARMVAVTNGSGTYPMQYMPPEELLSRYSSTEGGTPSAFTIIGSDGAGGVQRLMLRQVPNAVLTLTLVYYKSVPTLVGGADGGTNWFLTKNPDAMTYAVLLEAAGRVASVNDVSLWQAGLQQAFNDIKEQDRASRWSGSALRVGNSSALARGC